MAWTIGFFDAKVFLQIFCFWKRLSILFWSGRFLLGGKRLGLGRPWEEVEVLVDLSTFSAHFFDQSLEPLPRHHYHSVEYEGSPRKSAGCVIKCAPHKALKLIA